MSTGRRDASFVRVRGARRLRVPVARRTGGEPRGRQANGRVIGRRDGRRIGRGNVFPGRRRGPVARAPWPRRVRRRAFPTRTPCARRSRNSTKSPAPARVVGVGQVPSITRCIGHGLDGGNDVVSMRPAPTRGCFIHGRLARARTWLRGAQVVSMARRTLPKETLAGGRSATDRWCPARLTKIARVSLTGSARETLYCASHIERIQELGLSRKNKGSFKQLYADPEGSAVRKKSMTYARATPPTRSIDTKVHSACDTTNTVERHQGATGNRSLAPWRRDF